MTYANIECRKQCSPYEGSGVHIQYDQRIHSLKNGLYSNVIIITLNWKLIFEEKLYIPSSQKVPSHPEVHTQSKLSTTLLSTHEAPLKQGLLAHSSISGKGKKYHNIEEEKLSLIHH